MVRVTGFYKWKDGAVFDHQYYQNMHMPLTREKLLPFGLIRLESDHFVTANQPLAEEIIAASYAYFESLEKAQAAMRAVGQDLLKDVPKYTTLRPEIKISVVTSHM